jgi:hypothetical protein
LIVFCGCIVDVRLLFASLFCQVCGLGLRMVWFVAVKVAWSVYTRLRRSFARVCGMSRIVLSSYGVLGREKCCIVCSSCDLRGQVCRLLSSFGLVALEMCPLHSRVTKKVHGCASICGLGTLKCPIVWISSVPCSVFDDCVCVLSRCRLGVCQLSGFVWCRLGV